ncbi:hypothetical protein KSP39_PZI016684 [Platanthera zijinensis]|uniref:PHD-type zinc finger plants domain-containing protein n=1 Tax=Platanthera zijinensis TaxID=2320716 RepID=A0AAP0B821_9ASPA
MGSSGGAQVSPPPPLLPPPLPQASIVCCMCGDRGLPTELFRCKICLFRSQHKYCSDLYPKEETYKACNWCLREDKGKPIISGEAATTSAACPGHLANASGSYGWKRQRGAPPLLLSKLVKKQRAVPPEQADAPTEKMRSTAELSPATSGRVRQSFRSSKVRRYKLLEEVSS